MREFTFIIWNAETTWEPPSARLRNHIIFIRVQIFLSYLWKNCALISGMFIMDNEIIKISMLRKIEVI